MENFLVAGSYNKLFYGYKIVSSTSPKEKVKQIINEEKNDNEEKEEKIEIEANQEKNENRFILNQKFLSSPHTSSFTSIASFENLCASGSTDESIK